DSNPTLADYAACLKDQCASTPVSKGPWSTTLRFSRHSPGRGILAHHVGVNALLDTGFLAEFMADLPDTGQVHGAVWLVTGEQPLFGLPPATIDAEQGEQFWREHDLPGELALAFAYQNQHPLAIDVSDSELLGFSTAQSCGV